MNGRQKLTELDLLSQQYFDTYYDPTLRRSTVK